MFAATGNFSDEVEANFAAVWTADEAWTRALLAGDVKPVEPEPVVEPEAVMEPEEAVEPEAALAEEETSTVEQPAAEEVQMAETAEPTVEEVEVAEDAAPAPIVEAPIVEDAPVVQAAPAAVEETPIFEEPMLEATDKENATNVIVDAGKMPFAKQLGEESAVHFSPVAGLAPKDVNVQPMEFA